MLEYACFPISSEILLPLSGMICGNVEINYFIILAVSVAAGVAGALICYMIGRIGGIVFLDKIKIKIPKLKRPLEASEEKYKKYSHLSTIIARLIPICRTYISFLAGMYKQNILSYIITSSIGIAIWNSILIYIGYYLNGNTSVLKDVFDRYKFLLLGIIIIIIIVSIFKKEVKHKKSMI